MREGREGGKGKTAERRGRGTGGMGEGGGLKGAGGEGRGMSLPYRHDGRTMPRVQPRRYAGEVRAISDGILRVSDDSGH